MPTGDIIITTTTIISTIITTNHHHHHYRKHQIAFCDTERQLGLNGTGCGPLLACIWLSSCVLLHLQHYDHAFDYRPLCPSPSTTSSMLTLCLKKIVAYNTWMLFLENKRLLPTSGSCFCLAWLWWRAKFWSSIQSSLLTISIILHYTGQVPNPVAAGLLGSQMGILTRLGWCKLLVTCCSAHTNSSTQRSRPHLLQQVRAHHHWEQGQLTILTFASIVYSHSHWQPNFDTNFFW